jgi:phytoene dehydrogenase-like protein
MAAKTWDVVVIGAGPNGLVAAAVLAGAGRKVVVVERSDRVGGVASSYEFHPGYRTPGLLHDTSGFRRAVVAELDLEREGLVLAAAPPDVLLPDTEGPGFLLPHDPGRAGEEIAAISERDANRYGDYRAFLESVGAVVRGVVASPLPDGFSGGAADRLALLRQGLALRRLGTERMEELLRIPPMCAGDWLREWFETERLAAGLAAPALTALSAGPWSPGTAANVLLGECVAEGHVPGGAWRVARALEAAAQRRGVDVRLEAEVEEILVAGNRVQGVQLRGGEIIPSPRVAASCDPRRTFLQQIPGRHLPRLLRERMEHYRGSGTAAKVHLAVEGPVRFRGREWEMTARARIVNGLNAMERAFDPVKYGHLPEVPWLDVFVPTVEAPELAPEEGHVVSVLAHSVPYRLKRGWTAEAKKAVETRVVRILDDHCPGFARHVVGSETLTPPDLEERFGLVEGQLHHGDHALDQLLVRPTPECARYATPIEGLFLCGSGSYPGGGLTGMPGLLGARRMLAR